jgi:hypothetical protein
MVLSVGSSLLAKEDAVDVVVVFLSVTLVYLFCVRSGTHANVHVEKRASRCRCEKTDQIRS